VKHVNNGRGDAVELWEDGAGAFVTGFRFLIFKNII